LALAGVRAHINAYLDSLSMTGSEVLAELTMVARASMEKHQQVIREYKDDKGQVVQVIRQDLSSKVKALEILAKARGLLADKVDINITETRTIVGISINEITGKNKEIK